MSDELIDIAAPPEIEALTSQLCEALVKLAEAKTETLAQEAVVKATLARYHQLFDQVGTLQKTINETITACLNLRK